MFSKPTAVSYRTKKSRAARKWKSHTRLLFLIGTVLIALVLTVIWGIVWGEQAQEAAERRIALREEEKALAANTPEWLPAQPAPIKASYTGRLSSSDGAAATVQALTEGGAAAISLPLYLDGTPQYDSAVAQSLGRQLPGATDVTLSRVFAAVLAKEAYIAATFSCTWQEESNTAMRRTLRAYEAALIAEIAESGADEVLLLDTRLDGDSVAELALFLREVRENCPDAVIGVSVSTAAMMDDHRVEWARTLLTWADFLALDLSDHATHTVTDTAEDGTVTRRAANIDEVLRHLDATIDCYRMRLLLPTGIYELLPVIEEMGYENWQIIR